MQRFASDLNSLLGAIALAMSRYIYIVSLRKCLGDFFSRFIESNVMPRRKSRNRNTHVYHFFAHVGFYVRYRCKVIREE